MGKYKTKSPRQDYYRGALLLRSPWRRHNMTSLLHNRDFIHQVLGVGHLVDDEQQVAHVHADGALHLVLEGDVAAHGLPVAVEGQTDEVAVGVNHRTAGVAARDVVGGDEVDHQLALLQPPLVPGA